MSDQNFDDVQSRMQKNKARNKDYVSLKVLEGTEVI
jgi:hypothetical protein